MRAEHHRGIRRQPGGLCHPGQDRASDIRRAHPRRDQPEPAFRRMAQPDAFRRRQVIGRHGFLMNGHDPCPCGRIRTGQMPPLPVDPDRIRFGLIDTGQHLRYGRLTGTMIADKGRHLTGGAYHRAGPDQQIDLS